MDKWINGSKDKRIKESEKNMKMKRIVSLISASLICSLGICAPRASDVLIKGKNTALLCHPERNSVIVLQLPCEAVDSLDLKPSCLIEIDRSALVKLFDALGGIDCDIDGVDGQCHLDGSDALSLIESADDTDNADNEEIKAAVICGFFKSAKKKLTPLRAISILFDIRGDVRCSASIGELTALIKCALAPKSSGAVYLVAHTKEEAKEIIDREF